MKFNVPLFLWTLLGAPALLGAADGPSKKPNIVLILADDLGARDLGCFGSTYYETPNINRLASQGVRLTNAYSASPLCSPTRSSILVGQHPARTGITAPVCHLPTVSLEKQLLSGVARVNVANSVTRLKPDYHTLAEALKGVGYATGHFGKWHLGHNMAASDKYEPRDQGFDVDWPHTPRAPGPSGGYLAPWKFITDTSITEEPGRHVDERMADEAGKFIRANKGQPFFLNFWLFSVHSPWNARTDYIEHFKGKTDPSNPQKNPLYAAMVKSMDDAVGRLLRHLDESGEAKNTLIVFWSDNGGYAYPPKQTDPVGFAEIPATSNLPLRSGKASLYEGGTREPGIVVWPGKVKAGTTADFLIQSTDLYPTLLSAAGVTPKPEQKTDGFDQTPALSGGTSPRTRVFCHFPHGNADRDAVMDGFYAGSYIREGNFKLIRFYARADDGSDELELYDLSSDLGERNNLAKEKPELAATLNSELSAFLKDTEAVIPKLNPDFGKAARTSTSTQKKKVPEPGDLPGGWKNRAGVAAVNDGCLNVQTKGANSFLGVTAPLSPGAASGRGKSCDSRGSGRKRKSVCTVQSRRRIRVGNRDAQTSCETKLQHSPPLPPIQLCRSRLRRHRPHSTRRQSQTLELLTSKTFPNQAHPASGNQSLERRWMKCSSVFVHERKLLQSSRSDSPRWVEPIKVAPSQRTETSLLSPPTSPPAYSHSAPPSG
jgi:arylsulfatase A-like enzyme